MRRERQLPEHLHPLALVVELANLLNHEEIKAFRDADRRLLEAQTEILRGGSLGINRSVPASGQLREQFRQAGDEAKLLLKSFVARAQKEAHEEAFAFLQNNMKWPLKLNLDDRWSAFPVFRAIAAIREALEDVVMGLLLPSENVRLPKDCYLPPPILYKRDGVIRVGMAPISHWLLPMLDGLDANRLRICEVCWKLFVPRRRDQIGCSRKCGDAMYMRRYRSATYRNGSKKTPSARDSAERRMRALKKRS